MELHLVYYGLLQSSGNKSKTKNKNAIRAVFAPQIKALAIRNLLGIQLPLGGLRVMEVDGHLFVPLITKDLNLVVNINALVLNREPPNGPMPDYADIDGRTKTFVDALRVPKPDEVKDLPRSNSSINCLLEDDSLVKDKNVRQGRLLAPIDDLYPKDKPVWSHRRSDTLLTVEVIVKVAELTDRNKGFIGVG